MNYLKIPLKKLSTNMQSAPSWLLTYIEVQLFITLCSWPFLQYWGIPLSPASILGNLIFCPVLTLFLTLASFIFFCVLIHVPHYPFSFLLELITQLWYSLLSQSSRTWLFIIRHPPFEFTLFLPLCAGLILHYKPLKKYYRIGALVSLFFMSGFIVPIILDQYSHKVITLDYYTTKLTIIRSSSTTILLDPGCLGRRLSAQKQVTYTLIPFLIRQGIRSLTHVSVAKPSVMVFRALTTLVASFPVERLYIPAWQGTLKNTGWAAWEQLLTQTQQYGTLITLVHKPLTIEYGSKIITLIPERKSIKRNGFTYCALTATVPPY